MRGACRICIFFKTHHFFVYPAARRASGADLTAASKTASRFAGDKDGSTVTEAGHVIAFNCLDTDASRVAAAL